MGALLYNVLEWAPENSIWRMKSLKWMMEQTINYSMIHFTPSISSSVQRNKSRWLNILSFGVTCLTGFCYSDKKGGPCYLPKSEIPSLSVHLLACEYTKVGHSEHRTKNCPGVQAFHSLVFVHLYQICGKFGFYKAKLST